MSRTKEAAQLPTLAIVDAFVGGVSIILVLILLTSFSAEVTGEIPRADTVLACDPQSGNLIAKDEPTRQFSPSEIAQELAKTKSTNLAHKVLITTHADNLDCANTAIVTMRLANETMFADENDSPRPVFIWDTRFEKEQARAPVQ